MSHFKTQTVIRESLLLPVKMCVCSLVLERASIRINGNIKQRIARVIIGFEDETSGSITFISKYVHCPPEDFIHNDVAFQINGIDRNTLAQQGERYSVVVDWFRAAIRSRVLVVCGTQDLRELVGETPCTIVDMHDYFFSRKEGETRIDEPISLARLVSKFYNNNIASTLPKNPFQECKFKISLYYILKAHKACDVKPPFTEFNFPKVVNRFSPACRRSNATEDAVEASMPENTEQKLSRYQKIQDLSRGGFGFQLKRKDKYYDNDDYDVDRIAEKFSTSITTDSESLSTDTQQKCSNAESKKCFIHGREDPFDNDAGMT